MNSPSSSHEDSNVVKAIKGVKLNVRKKAINILIESNGELNDEWEGLDAIDDSQLHLLEPFQEAIDHLKSIDVKSLGTNDRPHPPGEENDEEYEVETILGVMHDGKEVLYYIKWDGWDIKYNNWEPESNCSCEELAEPFADAVEALKKQFDKPRAGPKSRKASATAKRSPKKVAANDLSSSEEEAEPVVRKPGPKSKTRSLRSSVGGKSESKSPRRAGPKSRTIDTYMITKSDATNGKSSPKKRPGPKSRTEHSLSLIARGDSDESDNDKPTPSKVARTNSNSDTDSDMDSSKLVEEPKKRPGPASRTSLPSARKPGPKSRTSATPSKSTPKKVSIIDDDDSSDY